MRKLMLNPSCSDVKGSWKLARNSVEFLCFNQYASGFRSLITRDDATTLQHVDQATGARVADAQAALDQRNRRCLRLDDDLDRLLEQRILVRIEVVVTGGSVIGRRLRSFEERLVELLAALCARLFDEQGDLFLGHERALQ